MKSSHTSDSNLQACFCASSDIVIEKDGQFDKLKGCFFFLHQRVAGGLCQIMAPKMARLPRTSERPRRFAELLLVVVGVFRG